MGNALGCNQLYHHCYPAANVHPISIAHTSLDQALKQLAIQTGTTISYDTASLSKIKSTALKEIIL